MAPLVPVVLAGGAGTRLWPLSRDLYPKQFQKLTGPSSMLQETLLRLEGLENADPIIVCSDQHRFLVADQCRAIGARPASIILEPAPRNTAPAIALGAMQALELHDDPVLLVLPSDHYIADAHGFRGAVADALELLGDHLMTFGIAPTRAHTGYGYIRRGQEDAGRAWRVARFIEKPDEAAAEQMTADSLHYWNSGMFLFRACVFLDELERLRPDIHGVVASAYATGEIDADFFRPGSGFSDCPAESIDYAVMERTTRSRVLPVDVGWSDVGSWSALWEVSRKDERGNAIVGDVLDHGSRNTYVYASHRLVATAGLDDCVVVETADAVLVTRRDQAESVKGLVNDLKSHARSESESHVQVFRPWGSYQSLQSGAGFQVKRITVNPGARLSLQMHRHRSEHWIVVRGTAVVTRGDDEFTLGENESTYIPLGARHRLSNPADTPLEIIEVQVGSYLGEDDIVRFDDVYGRS
jgi:mannose-1-phosphate guanylyltransferase/mannose-6-phosphate isomerase